METVLVTGVAGFIGNEVARLLLQSNRYHVVGIDNMNDYYSIVMKKHRLESLIGNPEFEFFEIDIESMSSIHELFSKYKFTGVFNLAARAGVRYSMENPHIYMSTNAVGTLNLLEAMKEHQVQKLTLASTSSLYAGLEMPFKEDLPVNQPISPYAASKKAAEVMAYTYHHLYNFDISVLRYFTVYGPAGRPDMSPFRFIRWINEGESLTIYGDGSQARDFTYVTDIATGTIRAFEASKGYEIFNIGGGNNPVSINQFIEIIENELGKKANIIYKEFHKADMMVTWANIDKVKQKLDWEPQTDLNTGIKNTIEWYLKNREWASKIPV